MFNSKIVENVVNAYAYFKEGRDKRHKESERSCKKKGKGRSEAKVFSLKKWMDKVNRGDRETEREMN